MRETGVSVEKPIANVERTTIFNSRLNDTE